MKVDEYDLGKGTMKTGSLGEIKLVCVFHIYVNQPLSRSQNHNRTIPELCS